MIFDSLSSHRTLLPGWMICSVHKNRWLISAHITQTRNPSVILGILYICYYEKTPMREMSTYHPLSMPQWFIHKATERTELCMVFWALWGKKNHELFGFSELLGKLVHWAPHPSWGSSLIYYLNNMSTHCIPSSSSSNSVTEKQKRCLVFILAVLWEKAVVVPNHSWAG